MQQFVASYTNYNFILKGCLRDSAGRIKVNINTMAYHIRIGITESIKEVGNLSREMFTVPPAKFWFSRRVPDFESFHWIWTQ
jgi:hypothetical protein